MRIDLNFLTKLLVVLCISLTNYNLCGQFHPDSLIHVEVQGNDTDPFITFDGAKKNQVFYNPTSETKSTLLLHLVGSIDNPNSTILFPTVAANNGFHCINLAYRNLISGQSACASVPDTNCHLNFRKEIIEGVDYSSQINVNAANSINNRLIKLLEYLQNDSPKQNWWQFYSGSTIFWDKIIVSGHSQGGGHAAVIAMTQPIQRVLMFASPNDYIDTLNIAPPWTSLPHMVADSDYYGFNALFDDVVDAWKQYDHWDALGLDNFGDTVNVDQATSPFNNSRQLYTNLEVSSGNPFDLTHDIMIRDAETPLDNFGNPIFTCVWRYMLGVDCGVSSLGNIHQNKNIGIYPNPVVDRIYIQSEIEPTHKFDFVIFDMFGRRIESFMLSVNVDNEINVAHYAKGIYILQIFDQNELIASKKIVKL